MLDFPRILAGLLLSTLIGGIAYRRYSLSSSGWLGAILTGTLTFGFGGWTWGLTLIIFFTTSSLLSHYQERRKQQLAAEKFEKGGRRDIGQVLANGGVGAALALLFGLSGEPPDLLALYAGIMATVTADTWATELGVLSTTPPRLITSGATVAPGTSGGITRVGVLASAGGALLIGISIWILHGLEHGTWQWLFIPAALLGGVAGSLIDSLLGATLQAMYRAPTGETEKRAQRNGMPNTHIRGWTWMTNDMVNLLSSLAGGMVTWGIMVSW